MHDFYTINNLPDVFANFFMYVKQLHNYNTRLASKNTYCIPSTPDKNACQSANMLQFL